MGLFRKKTYTGVTENTKENLVLDAGVFFKNYDVENDTVETAIEAGKLLGATEGGGEFTAKPEIRYIEADGLKNKTKGFAVIDDYEVSITANMLEITEDILVATLSTATKDTSTNTKYTIIKPKETIEDSDYITNITWIGCQTGSKEPLIIQIFNALSQDGLSLKPQKKSEAVLAVNFAGHYDISNLDEPPFAIYYPVKTA